ncbi:ABC transporter substrate-binding protein [Paralimibaculum aggregatum]|uniref:ABC transporter substrate-binding protein n=1 Tax=Paralimibaculum aggregatum TaxID=3036245 RepID=A0ABQ6LL70_9RHOB|nr:ABC transporter substrate-binding protein [Limibaculum sp. NKW23]GMG83959.1 ABC transporter substrate-binding protein [Limibaculum sp. NKW23]
MTDQRLSLSLAAAIAASLSLAPVAGHAQETFKIGLVNFLSGPAADAFGVPSMNGGVLMVEALNAGQVPAPYDGQTGIGGLPIEFVQIDESGGAQVQIQRYRDLVEREEVDAVLGYDGSGDCLAIAPVADELQTVTIFSGCGTTRLFEEASYDYVFRAGAHTTMDNVALAHYIKRTMPETKTVAGLNQNYSWGQDSWRDFTAALTLLMPEVEIGPELFPEPGAGQYGSQISVLMRAKPDVVHSSLWGGDLEAFLLQAGPRQLFARSHVVFNMAEHVLPRMGEKAPVGLITGGRGAVGELRPRTELADWFYEAYAEAYGIPAVQGPFRFVQTILALKTAAEIAMAENGGTKPTDEEIAAALAGLVFETPSGTVEMALADGHQAIQGAAIGIAAWNDELGRLELTEVEHFAARCVNPPAGVTSLEWIEGGMVGAECE